MFVMRGTQWFRLGGFAGATAFKKQVRLLQDDRMRIFSDSYSK